MFVRFGGYVRSMQTIRRGNAAEAAVMAELVEAAFDVFLPFGGGSPFGLLAITPEGDVLRLQVKSGRPRGDCLVFNTCATDHGHGRRDYAGRADVIAAHVPGHGVFVVAVDDRPAFCASLRLSPTRNGRRANVCMAADHTVARWPARRVTTPAEHRCDEPAGGGGAARA